MKSTAILVLLLLLVPTSAADESEFIVLTEGIVSGVVSAEVRRQVLIVARPGPGGSLACEVWVMNHVDPARPRTVRRGTLDVDQYRAVSEELTGWRIWDLPREQPTGSEDIYRLDTSIHVHQGRRCWRNGGAAGVVEGKSSVQPSRREAARFAQMVRRVIEVAEEAASGPADEEAFRKLVDATRMRACR